MDLNKIYIVLDHPDECRNIGSVCRAMANSGIYHLRIVGKKEDYDIEKIYILAIHAAQIYDNAEFFDSIKEAVADCSAAAGTTRRRGKKRKGKLLLPEEFANTANNICGEEENSGSKVAVVFGNERTGLTDLQLKECTLGVTIPSCSVFPSLNLSHAVQIICYELFRKSSKYNIGYVPVSLDRIEKCVFEITENLEKIGFFRIAGKTDMEIFWKGIFSRAAVSEGEVQYIEKIFRKAAGLVKKNADTE